METKQDRPKDKELTRRTNIYKQRVIGPNNNNNMYRERNNSTTLAKDSISDISNATQT